MTGFRPRAIALLLAAGATALLAGCGDGETTVTQTVTASEATESSTTATESTTTSTESTSTTTSTTEDVVADCENLSVNISGISVRNISCDDALQLLTDDLGSVSKSFALGGFQCARISGGRLGGVWRCTDGDQAIRFSFGD